MWAGLPSPLLSSLSPAGEERLAREQQAQQGGGQPHPGRQVPHLVPHELQRRREREREREVLIGQYRAAADEL